MNGDPRPEHDPDPDFDITSFSLPDDSSEAKPPEDEGVPFEDMDLEDEIRPDTPERSEAGHEGPGPEGEGFDLRLMSWGDGTGVPTSGNDLVIVGTDNNNLLHIRVFDSSGNQVTDTDETRLPPAQAQAILTLKQRLPGLLPPHVVTHSEKAQILGAATSIVGQTQGVIWPGTPLGGQPASGGEGPGGVIWPGTPVGPRSPEPPPGPVTPTPTPPPPVTPKVATAKWPFVVTAASLLVAAGGIGWGIVRTPSVSETKTAGGGTPEKKGGDESKTKTEELKAKVEVAQTTTAPNDTPVDALKQAQDAVASAKKSNDNATWRQAVVALGDVQESLGKVGEARETFKKGLAEAKSKNDEESQALFEASIEILDGTEESAPSGAEPKAKGPGPQGRLWNAPLLGILVGLQAGLPPLPAGIQQKIDQAKKRATTIRDPNTLFALALAYQEAGNQFQRPPKPDQVAAARYFKLALDRCGESIGELSIRRNPTFQKKVYERMKIISGAMDVAVTDIVGRLRESETTVGTLTTTNTMLAGDIAKLKTENVTLTTTNGTLAAENTRLVAENGTLKTENARLVAENGPLKTENARLVAENRRLQSLGSAGSLARLTHGEDQWASFAARIAARIGANPVELPGRDDRWNGPNHTDARTEGWIKGLETRLDGTINGLETRLADTIKDFEIRLAEANKRTERLSYGERQWAGFAQGLASSVGFRKNLPGDEERWKNHPETDAETVAWMDGLGQIVRDEAEVAGRLAHGEQQWAQSAERVARKVGFKAAFPKGRWARRPDAATERWINDLEIFISPPPPWTPPPDLAVKEYDAGLDDYFHCRYPQAVARFDAAIAHAPHGDALLFYFRGLARLADHQTGGASTLEEATQDLRHGIELEGQERPSSREVSRALARIQYGLRQWIEVFRTTGSPPPGPPPPAPPCSPAPGGSTIAAQTPCPHAIAAGCACSGRLH